MTKQNEMTARERAAAMLRRYYGYTEFRPGQWEIIDAVACGRRDAVVLMPTGGGKSMCFQMVALLMDGMAVVISPLIALMDDQVQALEQNGIAAAAIHSGHDEGLNRDAYRKAESGTLKLLYISPERLLADIGRWGPGIRVSMVAVDEAHCISQWGHDFRPVYTQLSRIKEMLGGVPVMALTATADRLTRDDIATQLKLSDPKVFVGSFDRPNLSLRVIPDPGKRERVRFIADMIRRYHNDAGIVYTLSRNNAEEMDAALRDMGFRSAAYHAGMDARVRAQVQRRFSNGDLQVICATIAFGMGIDKSNIRWVVHSNLPGNIECYYQEIGRAGRDGMPAETVLFFSVRDIMLRRSFADDSGMPEVNHEKLSLMERYAESDVCRRRILLSYFSETLDHDCGNCDNCKAPPQRFDGTVEAQKALSAVVRTGQKVGASMLVDILRGSARRELIEAGWHQIKTYGAGRDRSARQWSHYVMQMIQLGLMEIAYEESMHLRVTPYGMRVVRGEERVMLSQLRARDIAAPRRKGAKEPARRVIDPVEQLFEQLKTVRSQVAKAEGVPAYMVFSDATLLDMARRRPKAIEEFAAVTGAGERKTVKYGKRFIQAIRKFDGLTATMPAGSSVKETLILFNAGEPPSEIAAIKKVAPATITNHLVQLIDEDMISNFRSLVNRRQYEIVTAEMARNEPDTLWARLTATGLDESAIKLCMAVNRYLTRNQNK